MNKDQVYYAKKYKNQGEEYRPWGHIWYDEERKLYIRIHRPCYSHYVKKHCNKRLRHTKFEPANQKALYRRVYNYWNELY